jgi:hypothetical protein
MRASAFVLAPLENGFRFQMGLGNAIFGPAVAVSVSRLELLHVFGLWGLRGAGELSSHGRRQPCLFGGQR